MSSPPYTVTKLVRWRVKDWVSCFSACKFPLDEEREKTNDPETSEGLPETMIMKAKVGSNRKDKGKAESSSSSSSSSSRNRVVVRKKENGGASSSRYPSLADDDYIVFCFKDDGQVHVLSEKNTNVVETTTTTTTTTSSSSNLRRFSLQLLRLEDEADQGKEIDSNGKGKGKEASAMCSSNEIQEITEVIEEDEEECIEISVASSDSNDQSDSASTSSFAFPIFHGEWIGSPVQMPRTQVQKPKNTLIHCCRF